MIPAAFLAIGPARCIFSFKYLGVEVTSEGTFGDPRTVTGIGWSAIIKGESYNGAWDLRHPVSADDWYHHVGAACGQAVEVIDGALRG